MEFTGQPVDSLDQVPDAFHPLYEQGAEGNYVITEKSKGIAGAVLGLNTALKKARADAKAGKVDLSALAEFGTTPEEISAGISNRVKSLEEQIAAKGGDVKAQTDKVRQEMGQAHAVEIEKLNAKATAMQTQLYTHLVENAATQAIVEAQGVPELLMPFIKTQVRVSEENNKFVVSVIDAAGEPRYSTVTGLPMSVKDLIAEMKSQEKYGRLFNSEAKPGGGGQPGSGNRKVPPTGKELSSTQKIAAGLNRFNK